MTYYKLRIRDIIFSRNFFSVLYFRVGVYSYMRPAYPVRILILFWKIRKMSGADKRGKK